jgi:hypothetical protein
MGVSRSSTRPRGGACSLVELDKATQGDGYIYDYVREAVAQRLFIPRKRYDSADVSKRFLQVR